MHFDPQERLEHEGQPVLVSLYSGFMVNHPPVATSAFSVFQVCN